MVDDQDIPESLRARPDILVVDTPEAALELLKANPAAHVLVEKSDVLPPADEDKRLGRLGIDSRLVMGGADYFLLRASEKSDKRVSHYLLGT